MVEDSSGWCCRVRQPPSQYYLHEAFVKQNSLPSNERNMNFPQLCYHHLRLETSTCGEHCTRVFTLSTLGGHFPGPLEALRLSAPALRLTVSRRIMQTHLQTEETVSTKKFTASPNILLKSTESKADIVCHFRLD